MIEVVKKDGDVKAEEKDEKEVAPVFKPMAKEF